jgi:pimeloyl-ACP methyl ester carboxylesterase
LQAVPPTLRIFAMDQRGHGDADKPADGYALVNFADDIEAFMDAVGLRSAVLLGSSSGGYVAQQVAVQAPHRVDGLVLVGAPRSLHVYHAILPPGQIDAMLSQREVRGFESP